MVDTNDIVARAVKVIASDASDRTLMDRLLLDVSMGSEQPVHVRLGLTSSEPSISAATIVCLRGAENGSTPALPSSDLRGRVVVFSDCCSESAVVTALEQGAHHYFDITEPRPVLSARLAAALRSHARQFQAELLVPPFRFDPSKRCVWRDDEPVNLSPKEFEFAYYLFSHRGRTVGNSELMTTVWSLPRTMDSRRIDTAACRVRKKMMLDGRREGWQLRRLRGEGYRLVERRVDIVREEPA